MTMSGNKCYSWPAEHLFPVDRKEGQVGRESVDKQGCIVCRVVFLRVKVLTHATYAHTTEHIKAVFLRWFNCLVRSRANPILNQDIVLIVS